MKPKVEYFVYRPATSNEAEITNVLNANAENGWYLITVDSGMYVMGREIERVPGPTPCAKHRDRPSVTWIAGPDWFSTACQECKDESDRKSNPLNATHVG